MRDTIEAAAAAHGLTIKSIKANGLAVCTVEVARMDRSDVAWCSFGVDVFEVEAGGSSLLNLKMKAAADALASAPEPKPIPVTVSLAR